MADSGENPSGTIRPPTTFKLPHDPKEVDLSKGFAAFDRHPESDLPLKLKKRLQNREEWDAYWKLQFLKVEKNPFQAVSVGLRYYLVDVPVTWFRETVIEPLHDKYKRPYYHRKLNRVPEIDQCGVNDLPCIFEAREQFRLDKLVDKYIMDILQRRAEECMLTYTSENGFHDMPGKSRCVKLIDDWQEAELNWFIKYGELGVAANVEDCYMKQKHRMIWERRHPEIMEARQKRYEEHKRRVAGGDLDYHFYQKGRFWQDKPNYLGPMEPHHPTPSMEGNVPLSRDWEYYKRLAKDEKFDPKGGKTADVLIHPLTGRSD